jgi:phospholipid/cholesterol/gamma-HCH transport system permease protein
MFIRNRIVGTKKKDKLRSSYKNGGLLCELREDMLYISGRLTIYESAYFSDKIGKNLKSAGKEDITFDLEQLTHIDSAGVMSLYYVKDLLAEHGITVVFRGGSESIIRKLEMFSPDQVYKTATPIEPGFFERIGTGVVLFFTDYVFGFLLLAANVFYWSVSDVFRSKTRREGEFVNQAIHIGVNATLIVVFLSFVIGYVMALQSSGQLRTFGANIFVVDLVVIAITSQMGPLITAILVAGRSGSAIAAEIATMKVTSELDALKTMGLNPIRFVVVPKLYACLFTMPFLVLLANVSGVLGGALAANVYLDITPEIFFNRAADVMSNKNLLTSFAKSQVYASIIVLTGSFYGFRVVRGAEGVGKVTTISVVVAITLVILADSILGLIFY